MKEKTLVFLKGLKEVVVILATIITVVVALFTVKDWKEEVAYKNKFEIAQETLESAYNLRDSIFHVRYMYTEFFSLVNFHSEERLKILSPAIINAKGSLLPTEVVFGEDTRTKLEEIIDISKAVESAFRYSKLTTVKKAEDVHDFFKRHKVVGKEGKLFFVEPDKDPLNVRIEHNINSLEADLKPYFQAE